MSCDTELMTITIYLRIIVSLIFYIYFIYVKYTITTFGLEHDQSCNL